MGSPTMTKNDSIAGAARAGLAAQGVLYAVIGFLALAVAFGDERARPSQKGAIAAVARQPLGRVALVVLIVGLAAHTGWRLAQAIRGESGSDDEDPTSVGKRLLYAGRALVYAALTLAALRILVHRSGGSEGASHRSAADVLSWPGGNLVVAAVGLVVVGVGIWNVRKALTRSFMDKLGVETLDDRQQRVIEVGGVVGYLARGVVFALVGAGLIFAGIERDPDRTRTLDEALRDLARTERGPLLLMIVAAGLIAFGLFRMVDAAFRRRGEVTHA